MAKLIVHIFEAARDYIRGLSAAERGAIGADIKAMSDGDFGSVSTKQLKGPVRELIVGDHRISYFKLESLLCLVRGFPKKSQKAPRNEIEYAEMAYDQLKQNTKKHLKRKMKNARNQKLNRATKSAKKLKWYTFEQVFKKDLKNKEFQRGYREEVARIKLARQIREARIGQKLTQETVAKRAEMPQSVIARLESGSHTVSLDTLNRVAHALGKEIRIS